MRTNLSANQSSLNRVSNGMKTLFVLVSIFSLFVPAAVSAQVSERTVSVCPNIVRDLRRGDSDFLTQGQVTQLQTFLVDYFDLAPAEDYVTGYFGVKTQQNVIKFQQEKGLAAFGFVGPLTRAAIRAVCGGETTQPTTCPAIGWVRPIINCSNGGEWVPTYNTAGCQNGWRCTSSNSESSCVTPWGTTIANGGVTAAYQSAQATGQCQLEIRYCTNGALSGSYQYASCTPANVSSGGSISASPTSGSAPLTVQFTVTPSLNSGIGSYVIDFGDGTQGTATYSAYSAVSGNSLYMVSHTYNSAGTYVARLLSSGCATNSISCANQVTIVVAGSSTAISSATLNANPTAGNAPLSVTFTTDARLPRPGTIDAPSYKIDFGDGSSQVLACASSNLTASTVFCSALPAVHAYSAAGTYTASLISFGGTPGTHGTANSTTIDTVTITVGSNTAPVAAQLSATPNSGAAPLSVTFGLANLNGRYRLDFGDATASITIPDQLTSGTCSTTNCASSSGTSYVQHTYTHSGTYVAKLYSLATGCTQNSCLAGSVVITATGVTGYYLMGNPASGKAPLLVTFTANAYGSFFGGIRINFGDGSSSQFCAPGISSCTTKSLTHTYANPGTYTATMLGIGEGNNSTLASASVTVHGVTATGENETQLANALSALEAALRAIEKILLR